MIKRNCLIAIILEGFTGCGLPGMTKADPVTSLENVFNEQVATEHYRDFSS